MVDPEFAKALNACQSTLRWVVALAAEANLTQAQRDYFGAHTYRRVDKEGTFHAEWQ